MLAVVMCCHRLFAIALSCKTSSSRLGALVLLHLLVFLVVNAMVHLTLTLPLCEHVATLFCCANTDVMLLLILSVGLHVSKCVMGSRDFGKYEKRD